jgi:PAS domain S-box-containing protein
MRGIFLGTHINSILVYIMPAVLALVPDSQDWQGKVLLEFKPVSVNILLLIILCLSIFAGIIVYLFSARLKNVRRELEDKNLEIDKIKRELETSERQMGNRNQNISKEFYGSESFFKTLVQSAYDGISFYDKDWNLRFANDAFYSIIGMDSDYYNATDPALYIHPDDKDYQSKRMEALKSTGYYEGELRLKHHDNYYVNLSTRSIVIKNSGNEILGYLTISRDISALRKYHEELTQARVEAETGNKLKASFLANISHEIRTPLNSVVGFANLLLSDDLNKEAKEEYIDQINHNSEKLLQIIGDIIDLSRLESSQIEITYEEASLGEIINEVIEETRHAIKRNEKPIILTVRNQFENNTELIFTDRLWLKRVLSHLMDNAVKFTLEGSVELSYSLEETNIVFRIKDTGIGINKENFTRIFEEFRQEITGHHRPFEGLGVGLTLAKEVIERMGGTISVESEKGLGSVFSFAIPYRPAGSSKTRLRKSNTDSSAIDWSSKKCLLVDDNKDVLIYLNRILIDTGINVIMARSGPEAIRIITDTPDMDVILLDMQMPGMNGIEVTREIRKIRKSIPIIAQTAFIFENDKDIILEAGCDACLIKPIRKEHLLTVMSGFISNN